MPHAASANRFGIAASSMKKNMGRSRRRLIFRRGKSSCGGTRWRIEVSPSHLLDTSVYCQPIKPKPLASVQRRWEKLGDEALAISIISEGELLYGLELKQSQRLTEQYEELLKDRLRVFPVDGTVARSFAVLKAAARRKGHACPDFDFLIAATARANGLTVATLNFRHFAGIEGVAVEDWAEE